jgi:hypothetical protein
VKRRDFITLLGGAAEIRSSTNQRNDIAFSRLG